MKCLDLTLPTPEENLACDEALLEQCEAQGGPEVLRFWESPSYFVVLGYGNKVATEVDQEACRLRGVRVLRRVSGGGTVVQGSGCLNYGVVLRVARDGELQTIRGANQHILLRQRQALEQALGNPVTVCGDTDLVCGGMKFSGNAQRRGRTCLLFHGTILLQFDLSLIERLLPFPSKQPAYRQGRAHSAFVENVSAPSDAVKQAIRRAWDAHEPLECAPLERITRLVREKYSQESWNLKF